MEHWCDVVRHGPDASDYQTANSLIQLSFVGAGEITVYSIGATRGWLTANNFSTNYTLTGPALPGFLSQWAPAAPLTDSEVIMIGPSFTTTPVVGSVVNVAFRLQAP
jgi:hypothetical protein